MKKTRKSKSSSRLLLVTSASALTVASLLMASSPSGASELFDRLKRPFTKQETEEPATNNNNTKAAKPLSAAQERTKAATIASEVAKGRMHERSGEWEKARSIYSSLTTKFPNDWEPYHRLGVVADQQRRFTEAQQHFTDALRLRPKDADIHNDLGYCFFLQGKLDKAESSLAKAIQIDPKNPRHHINMGMVLGHKGKHQEAFLQFSKAGSEADAFYNLAFIYASTEQAEQAKECFRRALTIDPKHDLARKALQSFDVYDASSRDGREMEVAGNGARLVPYKEGADKVVSGANTAPGKTAPIADSSVKKASFADAGAPPQPRQAANTGRMIHNEARGLLNRNMSSNREPANSATP